MSRPLTDRHSFSYEELIDCGKGKLFGPGNALLPLPPMLMFDRIIDINEDGGLFDKGVIVAELDVNPDLWFFKCHFETDPVMPGCLGLDAKLVTYRVDMKRVIMRKLVMGIGDATMEVDGREIYSARDLRVGLFTSTDDF